MRGVNPLDIDNQKDTEGNVTGGTVTGLGLHIQWQNGGRKLPDGSLDEPNGAFVEDVLFAAKTRLEAFQGTKFQCRENALAITKIEEAIHWLQHRSYDREVAGKLGSHEV